MSVEERRCLCLVQHSAYSLKSEFRYGDSPFEDPQDEKSAKKTTVLPADSGPMPALDHV
jgi:hypothetical protein